MTHGRASSHGRHGRVPHGYDDVHDTSSARQKGSPMPPGTAKKKVRKGVSSGPESKQIARRDRVVKSILHRIFSGDLVGGDRLVEEELAASLGVSRTPIREALRELTAVGVIWLKP